MMNNIELLSNQQRAIREDLQGQMLRAIDSSGAYISSGEHLIEQPTEDEWALDFKRLIGNPEHFEAVASLLAMQINLGRVEAIEKGRPFQTLCFVNYASVLATQVHFNTHLLPYYEIYAGTEPIDLLEPHDWSINYGRGQYSRPDPGTNIALVCGYTSDGRELKKTAELVTYHLGLGGVIDIFMFAVRSDLFDWAYFQRRGINLHWLYKVPWDLTLISPQPKH